MKKKRLGRQISFTPKEIRKVYKNVMRENRFSLFGSETKLRAFCLLTTANREGCSVNTVRNAVDIADHIKYRERYFI